jgi:hypothetical protein
MFDFQISQHCLDFITFEFPLLLSIEDLLRGLLNYVLQFFFFRALAFVVDPSGLPPLLLGSPAVSVDMSDVVTFDVGSIVEMLEALLPVSIDTGKERLPGQLTIYGNNSLGN